MTSISPVKRSANTISNRRVVLYIAASLDGYIAKPDGNISWLTPFQKKGEDYGYGDFIKSIDTVIIGRKTYDKVLSFGIKFPHEDKECYIITHKSIPAQGNLTFYNGSLKALVTELKSRKGKNIFVDGGAQIVNELMKDDLIDEYIISVIPVLLGGGIRLFGKMEREIKLKLTGYKSFDTGLVQLHYKKTQ